MNTIQREFKVRAQGCLNEGFIMKPIPRLCLSFALMASILVPPSPARAEPCTDLMCLSGLLMGGSGGPLCQAAVTSGYFAIQVWDPGFDPVATTAARAKYLALCAFPLDIPLQPPVNKVFGPMPTPPVFPPIG